MKDKFGIDIKVDNLICWAVRSGNYAELHHGRVCLVGEDKIQVNMETARFNYRSRQYEVATRKVTLRNGRTIAIMER